MKYALFSCLYPVVGCYMYAIAAMHATSHLIVLFPIPIVLLVVGFGLNYAWRHRTRERIDQLVRGNLILMVVWIVGGIAIQIFHHHALLRG
jgi:uncharacterized BrkB/YihY/UPF0761 family membrane protein